MVETLTILVVFMVVVFVLMWYTNDQLDRKMDELAVSLGGKKTSPPAGIQAWAGLEFDFSGRKASLNLTRRAASVLSLSIDAKTQVKGFIYGKESVYRDGAAAAMARVEFPDRAFGEKWEVYSSDANAMQKLWGAAPDLDELAARGFQSFDISGSLIRAAKSGPDTETDLRPENVKLVLEKLLALERLLH